MTANLQLASISWIDDKSVPKAGFWFVAGALTSWPKRVVMGLIGTSNPEPPSELPQVSAFAAGKQYRALLACKVDKSARQRVTDLVLDGGYTPPFNKAKLDTALSKVAPIPDDPNFYAGEVSALSAIVSGKLHSSSALSVPHGFTVAASAFIKFRAGAHTDAIGIKEAQSPVHVPWVWCEYALALSGSKAQLLCRGSSFPSHAWYVAGRQVAKCLQKPIAASEHDPALSTGQPASHPRTLAETDKSSGSIVSHPYSIGASEQQNIDITAFFK